MDKNLLQKAKAPMIALIYTKNIMKTNNLKTKKKHAFALLLMLLMLAPLAAWAQNPDCNGPIAITADAPYFEGFESPTGTSIFDDGPLPGCWEAHSTGWTTPAPHNCNNANYAHSGSQSLAFYTANSSDYAVLPEFSNPISDLQISFWMRTNTDTDGQLQLGYITAEDDGTCNTFTPVATYANSVDYVMRTSDLSNVPVTAVRLVLKWENSFASVLRCFIDDMTVSINLALKPTELTCTEVTGTSATLTWTSYAESWQIMLNDDEDNLIMAETNPFTLTGLVSETLYTAKVRSYWDSDNQSEWSDAISFMPTNNHYIGSGDGTTDYLPLNNYYKYALTQQIYTVEEMGAPGLIESISFFKNNGNPCNRNIDIYIVGTDKSEFESTSDWIAVTKADRVFSGMVSFASNDWTTITLDLGFVYDGTQNMAIIFDDNTGSYTSYTPFKAFAATTAQALYFNHDNINYDPTGTPGYGNATLELKNQMRLFKSELSDCMKTQGIVATEVGPDFAVIDWIEYGTSESWLVSYNGVTVEADEHPFTLTGLQPETEYTIAVSPTCDTIWNNTVTITTLETCPMPVVTLGTVTATTAELSWTTSFCEGYTVVYRESIVRVAGEWQTLSVDEAAVTLTNLVPEADYEVKVIPSCDETKESAILTFTTTEPCENMCALTFVVTDSYGDGWNGNAIQVKDVLTGDIIATIANENLDGITGSEETQTIALNVCDGQELEFSWVGSYYNHIASYTVTDLNEVIVEGSGSGFATFNYTVSCTVTDCRRPTAFAASEIGPHSVVLSWTENGPSTEWEIAYKRENDTVINYVTATTNPYTLTGLAPETQYAAQVTPVCEVDKPSIEISWTTTEACPKPYDVDITPYPYTANVEWSGWGETYDIQWAEPVAPTSSAWLRYDNGRAGRLNATSSTNRFTWGVMYPADSLHDNVLTKIVFYEFRDAFTDSIITLNVYSGVDTIPETLIGTETITKNGTQGWHEVVLSTPIEFNPEQNLWITLTATGHPFVMAMSFQDVGINGRWFLNGSDWVDFATLFPNLPHHLPNVATSCFAIRGFVETYDYSTWNWTTESGVASPFTITGLEAETDYAVRVKSNCGQDCESSWTWAYFTTLEGSIFTKDIIAHTDNGGWYLIASPVAEAVTPTAQNGFLANEYDLYRFNQSAELEWENWKAEGEHYHFILEAGRGYLYANSGDVTLTFVGTPHAATEPAEVPLAYDPAADFAGWNLVGNPLPEIAFIDRDFYVMNGDRDEIVAAEGNTVELMEGIFVIAEGENDTMTFTPASQNAIANNASLVVSLSQGRGSVIDRAIVRFNSNRTLPKFQLNPNSTKVYIPQGGKDYAVVAAEQTGEMPLNFKAEKNGTYTLRFDTKDVEFDYLHLIDNLTGADVDLLAVEPSVPEPVEGPNATGTGPSTTSGTSYTFTAKTTDYESRFKLVFSADEDVCEPNAPFAYINNGNIVINGAGTLQIIDILGKELVRKELTTLNSQLSTSNFAPGVYVLRLVGGDSVRTQKIVID